MTYNSIIFEIEKGVGLIRLNRPDHGNAIIPEMG
jgi:enoyl-CoA hydratase/carnithine racemase